ncbi:MAG: NADP-dependent isocitrate dehydrogenase [Chlamydiales bacterium]|nr:NADP-dependent isocitrate dehydrogenase [Chlamydiales bacterium]
MTEAKVPIAVARGDGIGPEIMEATLHILEEAGAAIEIHEVEIGEKVYLKGSPTGIEPATWETIRRTKAFLKAPITTPQGGGFKSLNVTIRTSLGLFANVRPCVSYSPYVQTKHPNMDLVIIRENEEDLYAGIEYRQTPNVSCSIKLISRAGSEKIVRYAFEYARRYNRKKVTCFTKDNIMKFSDGLFHKVFDEIAAEYPDIVNEHWIVDIGAAKMADTPEAFDVIVLPNLYGDILSDVAAQISGSVGLAGSANIGDFGAMFEAIHGSAPRRAGQNVANPSGLLLGSVLMLQHIGQPHVAARIHNAWLKTIEEGVHTYDIFKEKTSKLKVGTKEFAQAVARNLGKKPEKLKPVAYEMSPKVTTLHVSKSEESKRELVGVDVFIYSNDPAQTFYKKLVPVDVSPLLLNMISNRGARIWPEGQPETFCIEQYRCRFMHKMKNHKVGSDEIVELLKKLHFLGHDIIKTEYLYTFDGTPGFSSAQG